MLFFSNECSFSCYKPLISRALKNWAIFASILVAFMEEWRPLLCHSGISSPGNPVLIYEHNFLKILNKYSEDLVMNESGSLLDFKSFFQKNSRSYLNIFLLVQDHQDICSQYVLQMI